MRKALLVVAIAASSAFIAPVHALMNGFAERGPNVISVGNDVYPNATTIVMAVYGAGIFTSADSGATFTESNNGLPNGNVLFVNRDLAVSPVYYAGMDGAGVYKSTDAGANWTAANNGLLCGYINHISANSATPAILYAGTNCSSATAGGVFRSLDSGATWTFQNAVGDFAGKNVRRVFNDEAAPGTVYAATTNGLWKSTDINTATTATWTQVGFNTMLVTNVSTDPNVAGVLLVSVRGHGVWLSINAGVSWNDVTAGLPSVDYSGGAGIDFFNPTTSYISYGNNGIYKGIRSGTSVTWSLWNSTLKGSFGVGTARAVPGVLFATGNNGFYKSINDGVSWTQLQNGLPAANMNDVQSHPTTPGTVYATNSDALYKSTDGGTHWTRKQVASGNLRSGSSNQIVLIPGAPDTVLLSTFSEGIYKSVDGGNTFATANTGLPVNLVALDATVTRGIDGKLYAGFLGALDGGAGSGVYRSDDGGVTWTIKTTGLTAGSSLFVRTIVPDPNTALTLYAVTLDGIYKTANGGDNWAKLTGAGTTGGYRDLTIDPADSTHLYAARYSSNDFSLAASSGVWKSTNGGTNWTQTALNTKGTQRVAAIRFGSDLTIAAAVWPFNPSGLYLSGDDGASWDVFSTGLRNSIRAFDVVHVGGDHLRIAGSGMGIRNYRENYGLDFEPNSMADVLFRHHDDFNYLWLMNGFTHTAVGLPVVAGPQWVVGGMGDIDQDGRSDIIWYYAPSGIVYAWLMDSTGVKAGGVIPVGIVGPGWVMEGVGDLNGDGIADILWRHSSGLVYVWYLNSAGGIASVNGLGTLDANWRMAGIADLNSDSNQDIVWIHEPTGSAYAWLMGANGFFTTAPLGQAAGWTIAKVADFDGDGYADLFWRNKNATLGENVIWYMNGATLREKQVMPSVVGANWSVAAAGDYDGDGLMDVLWYYAPTGDVYFWLMNGAADPPSVFGIGQVGANWYLPGQ
jgi:FG-GAP-like repeat